MAQARPDVRLKFTKARQSYTPIARIAKDFPDLLNKLN